ncbi:coiled-coil domain-containing protein 130-like [Branchiostoma floridae]|uniref:Probable splicing factor YJU2B n=1 Tax=Branchiostoma floridae TaxID=7739 RepID=A0A9J7MEG4_BRAFL|nr:coiled-coil domain-containing protein 130-like [Branchiostoma floridae]
MSDRKAVNRYYPPDFDPQKHKSINKYRNSHPLRDRARKLSQGILIIRFELPYNIWCGGCGNHVGMGVRYNAEKTKVGMYYTTPIYKFRMKCHLCDNRFEIQTDPKNCDYVIVSGARRKEERWDAAENEQVVCEDHEDKKKMASDPMFRLEHGVKDQDKRKAAVPRLAEIHEWKSQWQDDFSLNQMARRKFRGEKTVLKEEAAEDSALLAKSSLAIPLVREHEDDRKLASLLKYHSLDSYEKKQKQKREAIASRSIFSSQSSTTTVVTPDRDNKLLDAKKKLGLSLPKKAPSAFDLDKPTPGVSSGIKQLVKRVADTTATSAKGNDSTNQTNKQNSSDCPSTLLSGLEEKFPHRTGSTEEEKDVDNCQTTCDKDLHQSRDSTGKVTGRTSLGLVEYDSDEDSV